MPVCPSLAKSKITEIKLTDAYKPKTWKHKKEEDTVKE